MQTTMQRRKVSFIEPWSAIPRKINYLQAGMPPLARVVFSYLCDRKDYDLKVSASYMEIAKHCMLSRSTVKNKLNWLSANGWVEKEPRHSQYTGKQIGIWYKIIENPFKKLPENEVKEAISNNKPENPANIFKLLKETLSTKDLTEDESDTIDKFEKLLNKNNTENVPENTIEQEAKQPENTQEIYRETDLKTPTKPTEEPKPGVIKNVKNNQGAMIFGRHKRVRLTNTEHTELQQEFGQELTERMISKLDSYIASSGRVYKSHYATIIKWIGEDREKESKVAPAVPDNARRRNRFANFEPRKRDWTEIERLERELLIRSVEKVHACGCKEK